MSETANPTVTVTTKRLPAVHLAVVSGLSPSFASSDIGPAIQPLYPRLLDALSAAGVEMTGPPIAYYDDAPDGGIAVHAGFAIDSSVTSVPGLEVVDLPGDRAGRNRNPQWQHGHRRRRYHRAHARLGERARFPDHELLP